MNAADHFREGEHLLRRCTEFGDGTERQSLATQANAHFLAALVALAAEDKKPGSIAWHELLRP